MAKELDENQRESPARTQGSTAQAGQPTEPVSGAAAVPATGRQRRFKKRFLVLLAAIPLTAFLATVGWHHWQYARVHVGTDDAYLTTDVVQITPQVAGHIQSILVQDNQFVRRGQLLARLDDTTFRVDVQQAKANLALAQAAENAAAQTVKLTEITGQANLLQAQGTLSQAGSGIEVAQSGLQEALATQAASQTAIRTSEDNARVAAEAIEQARAARDRARQDAAASQSAVAQYLAREETAQRNVQSATAGVEAARANITRSQQAVEAASAAWASSKAGVTSAEASITAAQALVEKAERDYARANELFRGGAAPRSSVDTAEAALRTARATLQSSNEALTQAKATVQSRAADLESARAGVSSANAAHSQAQAQVAIARQGVAEARSATATARAQQAALVAAVKEAETGIRQYQAKYAASRDTIEQARAVLRQTQAAGSTAGRNIDVARGKAQEAQGVLRQAQTAPRQTSVAVTNLRSAHARVLQAQAALEAALINLNRTHITAPVAGYVSKRTGQVGQQLTVGQPIMTVLPQSDIWVIANYKETQLAHVHEGQKVEVEVDGLPGHSFTGHVNSIAAGTGSVFALLPPENATGNFTKVVQRIPVKVTLDRGQKGLERLRAGMSVYTVIEAI